MTGTAVGPGYQNLALLAVFRCCGTAPAGEDAAPAGVTLSSCSAFLSCPLLLPESRYILVSKTE